MKEREKRDAERKAFQKLIAKKKKQNRSHSVSDEEDVILVAPNRHNAHPQQRKHQLVRLQPAQATPKKVAAASKEGSPQATHTPPKIGSSKGKVEREKEKRSEDVQRSSPFANRKSDLRLYLTEGGWPLFSAYDNEEEEKRNTQQQNQKKKERLKKFELDRSNELGQRPGSSLVDPLGAERQEDSNQNDGRGRVPVNGGEGRGEGMAEEAVKRPGKGTEGGAGEGEAPFSPIRLRRQPGLGLLGVGASSLQTSKFPRLSRQTIPPSQTQTPHTLFARPVFTTRRLLRPLFVSLTCSTPPPYSYSNETSPKPSKPNPPKVKLSTVSSTQSTKPPTHRNKGSERVSPRVHIRTIRTATAATNGDLLIDRLNSLLNHPQRYLLLLNSRGRGSDRVVSIRSSQASRCFRRQHIPITLG
ncbi:hypothetical protein BLNAU_15911 [Blattamonas nauphoetae]|uniref:Uncharacterized protein n=1 Tax=Blattamonas nauphoetae TaxID=2049346 RepID=A0ABQ9XD95_9EUKA|nr:hypothetical protein BLNAU_15911 [Blattamonas nauphoetae]